MEGNFTSVVVWLSLFKWGVTQLNDGKLENED
jgi:hypothetical protein